MRKALHSLRGKLVSSAVISNTYPARHARSHLKLFRKPSYFGVRFFQMSTQNTTIEEQAARYITVDILPPAEDIKRLADGDRRALKLIIEASQIMDSLFLRQTWKHGEETLQKLKEDQSEAGKQKAKYYWLNRGPWSILDEGETFLEGAPQKPKGANFYPEDMTQDEFEKFVATLSESEQKDARGFFHVVRRNQNGQLQLVPYSEEYKANLTKAADLLRQAATATPNATMKNYLTKRADSFLSNDYFDSDVAWMELDNDAALDVTIGPYEVYRDELFNYKAAFVSFVALRDFEETAKLAKFSTQLQDVENNLPIKAEYRNPKLGEYSPIVAVNLAFSAGDVAGPQCAAFNLPNDEKVVEVKGSKRVMLKNVQQAKFDRILIPIAASLIDPSQQKHISFDAFFTHILAHELMHGLGPHNITLPSGKATTVRSELQDLHSAWEEAKADITGLFALQYFIDTGSVSKEVEESFYVTFLASAFRSIRFGLEEAHGKGQALQLTYLLEQGGFTFDAKTNTFAVDMTKIKEGVRDLTSLIMTAQAEGDKERAKQLLAKYAVKTPELEIALNKLKEIPVDISPVYHTF